MTDVERVTLWRWRKSVRHLDGEGPWRGWKTARPTWIEAGSHSTYYDVDSADFVAAAALDAEAARSDIAFDARDVARQEAERLRGELDAAIRERDEARSAWRTAEARADAALRREHDLRVHRDVVIDEARAWNERLGAALDRQSEVALKFHADREDAYREIERLQEALNDIAGNTPANGGSPQEAKIRAAVYAALGGDAA